MNFSSSLVPKLVQHFPTLTRLSLKPVPDRLLEQGLALGLNRTLKPYVLRGDMAFLESRWVMIDIPDIALRFRVTLANAKLAVDIKSSTHDVCFKSNLSDLLQVIAGSVDPDTLFFRRRLMITGDTELGLSLKNFLDTLEPRSLLPDPAFRMLSRFATHAQAQAQ